MISNIAVILAGGSGTRFSSILPKQFWFIDGEIVLQKVVTTFMASGCFDKIICTINDKFMNLSHKILGCISDKNIEIINGGNTRQESVYNALHYLHETHSRQALRNCNVIVHDSARYACSQSLIHNIVSEVSKDNGCHGVIPCISATDSVIVDNKYVDRNLVRFVQTPQGFKFTQLYNSHLSCKGQNLTDDGSLLQKCGYEIKFIPGEDTNIKLTQVSDYLKKYN